MVKNENSQFGQQAHGQFKSLPDGTFGSPNMFIPPGRRHIEMEKYCDIIPHATGWVYVIDGVQSASYYHTYDLAMDAAKAQLARSGSTRDKVFRRQALNGERLPVQILAQGMATLRPSGSFRH